MLTVSTPVAELLSDAVEILGPTDPGIVSLEQNSSQVGYSVLSLVIGECSLIFLTAGCRHDALSALEQSLDFLWGHISLGAGAPVDVGMTLTAASDGSVRPLVSRVLQQLLQGEAQS